MLKLIPNYFQDASILRRLAFVVTFLNPDTPDYWDIVLHFAIGERSSKVSITPQQIRTLVENLDSMDKSVFQTDEALKKELLSLSIPGKKPVGHILISPEKNCVVCGSTLVLRKDRYSSVVIYDEFMGTIPGIHMHKLCSNRRCNLAQYYSYYTIKGKAFFNKGCESLMYFGSSRDTFFSVQILQKADANILIGQLSFKQQAENNFFHKYDCNDGTQSNNNVAELLSRQQMDRRRLEEAFLQYAVLKVLERYPSISLGMPSYHEGFQNLLSYITPQFRDKFTTLNAEHLCDVPGCGKVLVLDGNMKNSREVCYATDAGYTEFANLPGKIRTGCPNTPSYKSRYCSVHVQDVPASPILGDISQSDSTSAHGIGQLPAMITSKRITRNSVMYQVIWLGRPSLASTWESQDLLPKNLISEFEEGIQVKFSKESSKAAGQTIHTLSTKSLEGNSPKSKKSRLIDSDEDFKSTSSGSFIIPDETTPLRCKTEKDTHGRLNHRTAGILAAMFPCGLITLIGELFGAESKGQVYGYLHSLLSENQSLSSRISTICYDDACHLCKYAKNSARSSLTATTKKLSQLNYVVDRMHFRGHTDVWCREHCNPDTFDDMKKVNSEVCEQTFSWLSKYARITRHMNRQHFLFYITYICDLHNGRIK